MSRRKLHDLSPNYDFVSVRAGIQQFTSDFRGFLFSEEQPGVRVFGNLRSNRIAYNPAWFHFLEKNTNSGLNTFQNRGQQVYVANVYMQDFLAKGYTTEFSFHYNRDDAGIHYDDNGFLVRPAPIGARGQRRRIAHAQVRAYYLGWAGNGHIGRINSATRSTRRLGTMISIRIAGRRVDINAQMAALEFPSTKTGCATAPRSSTRRAIPATARSVPHRRHRSRLRLHRGRHPLCRRRLQLLGPAKAFGSPARASGWSVPTSLLPSLRSNKEEGQANFVNPGTYARSTLGADFNVTPKLRAFVNANYLRFDRTEPLELLLFQRRFDHSIGTDFGVGCRVPSAAQRKHCAHAAALRHLVPGRRFRRNLQRQDSVLAFRERAVSVLEMKARTPSMRDSAESRQAGFDSHASHR